ncbi:unnamed protein product [marine sediment metagenome]|uniref:Uncharacterized protein n=1 Tax=marine sediment metagenome TaxID=412755 RepID=X0SFG4_9ZZZZ
MPNYSEFMRRANRYAGTNNTPNTVNPTGREPVGIAPTTIPLHPCNSGDTMPNYYLSISCRIRSGFPSETDLLVITSLSLPGSAPASSQVFSIVLARLWGAGQSLAH